MHTFLLSILHSLGLFVFLKNSFKCCMKCIAHTYINAQARAVRACTHAHTVDVCKNSQEILHVLNGSRPDVWYPWYVWYLSLHISQIKTAIMWQKVNGDQACTNYISSGSTDPGMLSISLIKGLPLENCFKFMNVCSMI